MFVQRIDNMFGTRSSVYLRNFFVDIYVTTFWRYRELFFSQGFFGTSFEGGKDEFYI